MHLLVYGKAAAFDAQIRRIPQWTGVTVNRAAYVCRTTFA